MTSRVARRASTKANVCMECQKSVTTKPGVASRTALSFKGRGAARLARHLRDVHGYQGGSRKYVKRMAKLAANLAAKSLAAEPRETKENACAD